MYEIEKKEQIRLLKAFALRRFDGCPFGPGDIVKKAVSDRYRWPKRGDVAIVVAVDDTIVRQSAKEKEVSENMAIAVITEDDIEFPDIRIFWVDSEAFVKEN